MLPYKFRGVAGIRNLTERWAFEKFLAPVLALKTFALDVRHVDCELLSVIVNFHNISQRHRLQISYESRRKTTFSCFI